MLNKNDPLIGAVQQIMQKSNAEREATRLVNEKFGVADRKALPHERQREWDSAYQKVLSEATDPSKYSEKQKRFAATKLAMSEESMMPSAASKVKLKGNTTVVPGNTPRDSTSSVVGQFRSVSPAAREGDSKTGTVGKTPWYNPIEKARKDNIADTMNRQTRVRTAQEKGGTLTGREDKWAARPEKGNLKDYGPAPGTLGAKLKTAAGGSAPSPAGQQAKPVPQSNPSAFKFTDAERKGKVSAERLKQWRSSQGAGSEKLSLGNFLNAAQGKTARAGGRNDMSQQQKTYNIKRSNLDRGQ